MKRSAISFFLLNFLLVTLSPLARHALDGSVWSAQTLHFALGSGDDEPSLRSTQRGLGELLGSRALSTLDGVTNVAGERINPLILDPVRDWSRSKRRPVEILQILEVGGASVLVLSDLRGRLLWKALEESAGDVSHQTMELLLAREGEYALLPHRIAATYLEGLVLPPRIENLASLLPPPVFVPHPTESPRAPRSPSYLDALEQEGIEIIREACAVAENPAMLFSMGKDSMVMLSLAIRAFAPMPVPFPIVIIDTRWVFQDMYRFLENLEQRGELSTIVYVNPEAIERDMNPFDFGSPTHTDVTLTQAVRKMLDDYRFDFVFGGGRRDEEKSRAKERIFSLRNATHGWDPKSQRPELWNLYNTALVDGQSMRVFPVSNWTELDIWRYIERENVDLVPLYFSKLRPVVRRNGALIMVDDERFPLETNEKVTIDYVRFRTLGCYPLTGGVKSSATSVADIIRELEASTVSERSSRVIDFDKGASMEQKKKDGYF